MQPDQTDQTTDRLEDSEATYRHNHKTLLSVLSGGRRPNSFTSESGEVSIRLERILVDRTKDTFVTFDGEFGIESVLKRLHDYLPAFVAENAEGRLVGLTGSLVSPRGVIVPTHVTLEAGGQFVYEVGPCPHMAELLQAIEHVDRQLHVATRSLDCDYELLAEGYNPYVQSALDVPLVPRTRWTLLNAYLAQTGRYARDMMRCSCATRVTIDYARGRVGLETYRLAVALSPIFMFLTDNVRSFRGTGARRCPSMTRSLIWEDVDPKRCGVVPGTFSDWFSAQRYLEWLEQTQPIQFTDSLGATTSTGKRTIRELMGDRILSATEALGLFNSVYPNVRLSRRMEFLQADALRPRMAVGYACFIKGIFCNALAFDSATDLIGQLSEDDVALATYELRVRGWDAVIYGRPISVLVESLLTISRNGITDPEELGLLDEIAELWDFGMVPRDAFVRQEEKADHGW